jgi:hypothetical protein
MTLALRRITILTIISGAVFGLSWITLLLINRFIFSNPRPVEIGVVLQASAGSLCFAYSVVHLRSTTDAPPIAQRSTALGIVAYGISLWILSLPHLSPARIASSRFTLPSQVSMLIGAACFFAGALFRRYHTTSRQIWIVAFGTIVISILFIYGFIQLWDK